MRKALQLFLLTLATLSAGCADTRYYWQSVTGHLHLMQAAKPIDDWLADEHTSPELKARLALAKRMRAFAVTSLALPDNASYHRYADLQRRAVVWNVVAAPVLSLQLQTWCFPVAGCVGYRGYFDEAQARAFAATLQAQGLEVSVYGVPAYSTLGWMNWAGGDPLLSTFIRYPEGELARLVFHELAHQVLYVKDDTRFNESFATAVERLGCAQWLAQQGGPEAAAEFAAFEARRTQFRALTQATRRRLAEIYKENDMLALVNADKLALKNGAMEAFRSQYAQLKAGWPGAYSGYDAWVSAANNAAFGAQSAYDDLVPAFEALYQRESRGLPAREGWQRFYDAVQRLAALPREQRTAALAALLPLATPTADLAPTAPLAPIAPISPKP